MEPPLCGAALTTGGALVSVYCHFTPLMHVSYGWMAIMLTTRIFISLSPLPLSTERHGQSETDTSLLGSPGHGHQQGNRSDA